MTHAHNKRLANPKLFLTLNKNNKWKIRQEEIF